MLYRFDYTPQLPALGPQIRILAATLAEAEVRCRALGVPEGVVLRQVSPCINTYTFQAFLPHQGPSARVPITLTICAACNADAHSLLEQTYPGAEQVHLIAIAHGT